MLKPVPAQRRARQNNPWGILAFAALFFFGGISLLFQREPIIAFQQSFRYARSGVTAISAHGAHILGLVAIGVAFVIVWLYFYLRRVQGRTRVVEHGRERI